MAKGLKPRTKRRKSTDATVPAEIALHKEWMAMMVDKFRRWLAAELSPWIDGPLSTHGEDTFNLVLCDGPRWYRYNDKPRSKRDLLRLDCLKVAAENLLAVELASKVLFLPGLFAGAIVLGQLCERLDIPVPVITAEDCRRGGSKGKLTDDEKANLRHEYKGLVESGCTKNAAVDRLRKSTKVSKPTIERVVGIRHK